jgi:hypothetical protein
MTGHNRNHLGLWHPSGEAHRLLPRHGEPLSIVEWFTQKSLKCLARFPIFCVFVALLTVIVQFWVVPLLRG